MTPLVFFWLVFRSALITTGGSGNLPVLHQDFVGGKVATDRQFAESLAVGQLSPGPSGLWVTSLGYFMGGVWYSVLALIGISLPPLLAVVVDKLYEKHRHQPTVEGLVKGLGAGVVGIFGTVMVTLLHNNKPSMLMIGVAVIAFFAATSRKVPVLAIIVFGVIAGIALG